MSRLAKLTAALGAQQAQAELRWMLRELKAEAVDDAVKLRSQGYPLQYILGTQPFGGLDIICKPGALIPRWETEEWCLKLSKSLNPLENNRVLDMCTGTGCVLFLLLHELHNMNKSNRASIKTNSIFSGIGIDNSEAALDVSRQNLNQLPALEPLRSRVELLNHDIHKPLPASALSSTVVTANPPYIYSLNEADSSVSEHEPRNALVHQPRIYEDLVHRTLETSATKAVFEVGYLNQIDTCVDIFHKHKWRAWGEKDSNDNWRTVWAEK